VRDRRSFRRKSQLLLASFAVAALVYPRTPVIAQVASDAPMAENLLIDSRTAATWQDGETSVVQLNGPVTLQLDTASLSADNAVLWLTPVRGSVIEQQRAEIALIGHARLEQDGVERTGDVLQVTGTVRGAVRVTAEDRVGRDLSGSELFKRANSVRPSAVSLVPVPMPSSRPTTTGPAPRRAPGSVEPVTFRAPGQVQLVPARDGKLAAILSGGVTLIQARKDGSFIELQADKAVLFTNLDKLTDLQGAQGGQGTRSIEDSVRSTYLEGDVRVVVTPAAGSRVGEQRLQAQRVFYDFSTDRAILTDAILHTTNPKIPVPMLMRADTIRQLTVGEYNADHVQLSTSEFATPSYSLAATKAYIRQVDSGDPRIGTQTGYEAQNVTLQAFGVPYFYMPAAGGTVSDDMPLRSIAFGASTPFGFYSTTTWGLFPSLGKPTPEGLDAEYTVGYYAQRGPGAGLDGKYGGSYFSDPSKDPWSFDGRFKSFGVYDTGSDYFGGSRNDVLPENEMRGHLFWEHQHFLPGDWQLQLRAGYVTDPTFLEQWDRRAFWANDEPHDLSAYLKKQTDTEAFTIGATVQPNGFVTTADLQQEQFEVERFPQITYHRIGDSPFNDRFTFFSDNSASALRFNRSSATLADQGYPSFTSPGLPSLGVSGANGVPNVPEDTNYRGDFRQELDYPFSLGQIRAVPYVLERYTGYTNSPSGDAKNRFLTAAGVRTSTAFWKVNDDVDSDLFDVHRLRHVVEPQVHVFTSGSSVDQGDVYLYDEGVDKINALSAAELALHQTWQTKRGGPGRWRSVDFLTFNVAGDFFSGTPSDAELRPSAFRGLFFDSMPEASIPRDAINADASWRVSDEFIVLADESYNLQESSLATTSIGLAARRNPRVTYYAGLRYIEPLDSNILTLSMAYELSRKYLLGFTQSYDFGGQNGNVASSVEVTRRFDKFYTSIRVYHDSISDESGISFLLYPEGLAPRGSAADVASAFGDHRR
jgi:hypothetical protein